MVRRKSRTGRRCGGGNGDSGRQDALAQEPPPPPVWRLSRAERFGRWLAGACDRIGSRQGGEREAGVGGAAASALPPPAAGAAVGEAGMAAGTAAAPVAVNAAAKRV
eukprot:358894-Chlamydomonas_euryale.AAC.1